MVICSSLVMLIRICNFSTTHLHNYHQLFSELIVGGVNLTFWPLFKLSEIISPFLRQSSEWPTRFRVANEGSKGIFDVAAFIAFDSFGLSPMLLFIGSTCSFLFRRFAPAPRNHHQQHASAVATAYVPATLANTNGQISVSPSLFFSC